MNLDSFSDGKSIWMDEAGAAFWLIPDGAPLAGGGFAIRNVLGARRSVDAAALEPFAIPREQADARARARLAALADALKETVAQILQSPIAPAVAAASGELRRLEDSVEHGVEAIGAGVRHLLAGVKSAFHSVEEHAVQVPDELESVVRAVAARLGALAKRD